MRCVEPGRTDSWIEERTSEAPGIRRAGRTKITVPVGLRGGADLAELVDLSRYADLGALVAHRVENLIANAQAYRFVAVVQRKRELRVDAVQPTVLRRIRVSREERMGPAAT